MDGRQEDKVARFIADLGALGFEARRDDPRVLYEVTAVAGALAGKVITTGVSVNELQQWPLVPPHWVHLPDTVQFAHTNRDVSDCLPGWSRHSRDIGAWPDRQAPAAAWLAHVRGLVSSAA